MKIVVKKLSIVLIGFIGLSGCLSTASVEEPNQSPLTDGLKDPPAISHPKICQAGKQVACNSLAGVWANGASATCDSSEEYYDVSACQRVKANSKSLVVETVYPARRDPRWTSAKCNQGDFVFEVSMPQKPSGIWIINLQGGGACVFDSSDPNGGCRVREAYNVMPMDESGVMFPADRTVELKQDVADPDFPNAIRVLTHYCSSDMWTGTNVTGFPVTWHGVTSNWAFTGALNVQAMLDILMERYGLRDNNPNLSILLSGVSAGGWGVTNNVHRVKERFPITADKGLLMAQAYSSFQSTVWSNPNFPIYDPDGNVISQSDTYQLMYQVWKSELYKPCLSDHPSRPGDCLTGDIMYKYVTGPTSDGKGLDIPFLIFQNIQDQLYMTRMGLPPVSPSMTPVQVAGRNEFIAQLKDAMGLTGMAPHTSSKIKWLYSVSDPRVVTPGVGSEPNVHPPICYIDSGPDGAQFSLDRMARSFWETRGQGPGRGQMPGEVRTYDVNYVQNNQCN